MALMLAVIKKRLIGGKAFENTWAIVTNQNDDVIFTEDDLTLIAGSGRNLNSIATNPEHEDYEGGDTLLQALIGFERQLISQDIVFEQVYLTDGKKNETNSVHFTRNLGYNGLWDNEGFTINEVAPGGIILQLDRDADSLTTKSGRWQGRFCLLDTEISGLATDLIDFQSSTARNAVLARVAGALAQSTLPTYFVDGAKAATQMVALPIYGLEDTPAEGQLVSGIGLQSITVDKPQYRQAKRGKKKAAA